MHIRNSILIAESLALFLACTVPFAATSCSVYDAGLLDEAPESEDSVRAANGASDGGNEERVDCDAGADAGSCTTAAPPRPEPRERPDASEPVPAERAEADECPNDPNKRLPGTCGCNRPDTDTDGDGTADCQDGCPRDERKTAAGSCGCGVPDSDTDGDGTPDCVDGCPRDGKKTAVGMCGCGNADTDGDKDGTADCIDGCPSDASKTAAGLCGCGRPEPANPAFGQLGCDEFAVLHRYTFDVSGNVVGDRVGNAPGTIMGSCGPNQTSGALHMPGDLGPGLNGECYVSLPPAAWPTTPSATFEAWFTWSGATATGGPQWQRIFDFGNQAADVGQTYLCVTPNGDNGVRAEFSVAGEDGQVHVERLIPLPRDVLKHVAMVIDDAASSLTLYVDGLPQGSVALPAKLANIQPVNLWLGRSNFARDPAFFGSLHEFRIYGAALTESQIRKTFEAGPDNGLTK